MQVLEAGVALWGVRDRKKPQKVGELRGHGGEEGKVLGGGGKVGNGLGGKWRKRLNALRETAHVNLIRRLFHMLNWLF